MPEHDEDYYTEDRFSVFCWSCDMDLTMSTSPPALYKNTPTCKTCFAYMTEQDEPF